MENINNSLKNIARYIEQRPDTQGIEDLRDLLVEYYIGNPPKGYSPMLDDTDMMMEDMMEIVEELGDLEVIAKCKEHKLSEEDKDE